MGIYGLFLLFLWGRPKKCSRILQKKLDTGSESPYKVTDTSRYIGNRCWRMTRSSDQVCHLLRTQILFGELRPGQPISQRATAATLSVSETPVREALLRLRHEGLVELSPRKGYVVRRWTPTDVRDRYGLRRAIEIMAVERAAEVITPAVIRRLYAICDEGEELLAAGRQREAYQADRRFHGVLVSASESREIIQAANLLGHSSLFFPLTKRLPVEASWEPMREHRRIVAALAEKRASEAVAALEEHLRIAEERVVACCEELHAQSYDTGLGREPAMAASALVQSGEGGGQ